MIRLSKSSMSEQEIAEVSRVLKEEYLGLGPEVQAFEKELKAYFGGEADVVCAVNGTASLQLALQAIGVKAGDEVLVPTLTYLASFQAISATGAKPVACEVNKADGLINLQEAEKRINKHTKAIMPVHYAGHAGNLDELYAFAAKHQLRIVEDAAHAFGSKYKNQRIGSIGDITCFSFDGIKNITAGEGGAIVTRDQAVIQKVKDLRLLGVMKDSDRRYAKERSWDFDVVDQGWRYHMSDIMASIGRVQLKRFEPEFKPKRMALAKIYFQQLAKVPGIELFDLHADNEVVPHIMPIKVLGGRRDALREHCISQGFQVGIHYKPNHLLTMFQQPGVHFPVAEELYGELLTLPLHVDLSPEQVMFITEQVHEFMRVNA